MKKQTFIKLGASVLAALSLTAVASAKGFTKTNEYTEGKFTDVPANQWYAAEVKSAYELGFMNGQSDTAFAPNGNVTVAEGITMASRVHANYNGKEIKSVDGGKWYDMYIAYAKENGLIEEGQFTNFDRNIMRYEMAVMFAKAMPADYFTAKNDIKDIPDVAESEEYYDELMMLYKAGVVLGSDDYGNFYATNPIKRSETAAIINRVALPENRKEGKLLEYGDRNQAVYLISNYSMGRSVRDVTYIASGWTYENPASSNSSKRDFSTESLVDNSPESGITARRAITVQETGNLVFEAMLTASNNGLNIVFEDSEGKTLFCVSIDEGTYKVIGKNTIDTGAKFTSGNLRFYIPIDLDKRTATLVVNGSEIGTYELSDAKNLASVAYKTTDEGMLNVGLLETYLYTNYSVNDTFRTSAVGEKLYGWDTTENVTVQTHISGYDKLSAAIQDAGSATKKFDAVSGKFIYETYVKIPANQYAVLEIKNGANTAAKVEIGGGKITSEGKLVREYNNTLWNLVRIEGDTATGKALIRINGKLEGTEISLTEKAVDNITITSTGTGKLWFDDVQLYNIYDYADYVPTPVPVNDDGFNLGMSICSLWREGSHSGWDCIAPYEDVTPILGYYDEGLPEVADWEIKFLAEHGYDFQHFCWYTGTGSYADGFKESRLGFALQDGYMNAKYSDMVKFAIMWENWSTSGVIKDYFLEKIWPYWCEWYFSDSRYMSIDNKAVLTLYRHPKFIEHMGGIEAAKEVIEFMREDIKKYGYDGMIILGTSSGSLEENKQANELGLDGFIAYHFGENSFSADYQISCMNTAFDNGYTPFLPSIGVGFNDIGWTETRTPLATAREHKKVFEWAKDDYLPRLVAREGKNWMGKFAITNTWNEFGEGHYVFPSSLNKFGYLDAARQVFSTVAGKDDSKHFDIEPTDNQKARLGYLYPARNIPLRRTQYISDNSAIKDNEVIKSWNFESEADCGKWSSLAKTTPTQFDANEKAITAKTLQNDAHIKMNNIEDNYFTADDVRYIHIRMKTDTKKATQLEIYYSSDVGTNFTSKKCATAAVGVSDGYVDYYIDTEKLPSWSGTIKSIRLDPVNIAETNFWIKEINLLSARAADTVSINVQGVDFDFNSNFQKRINGDIYVAGNPTNGFYSLNGFYYEWNRWTGKLLIRTYNNHEFLFTVGSNIMTFDGKEYTLSSEIVLADGLPMLPIKLIYDKAEYDYTETENRFKVNIRGIDITEILASRKENEYEFNVPGDNETWRISGAGGGVLNGGYMYLEASFNGTRYDSQIVLDKTNIKTTDYNRAEVRYKPIYKDELTEDQTVTLYFGTTEEPNLNEKKKAWVSHKELEPDKDGYYTITFDLASNELWSSTATIIRFDPPNRAGEFYIDYIRFLEDPDKIAKEQLAAKAKEEAMKAYMVADEGKPFYIENADAEAEVMVSDYGAGNAAVTIVEDDLNKGNHAFLVTPRKNTSKVWTYFIAPTRFKPGATYKVEFDFRVISDHYGADAIDVIPSVNFRYADVINGEYKNAGDHPYPPTPKTRVSTKDGWIHYSSEHTISVASPNRDNDRFTIFVDPKDSDAGFLNHIYMIDNIKVTVLDPGAAIVPENGEATDNYNATANVPFISPEAFRAYGIDGLTVDGTFKGKSNSADPSVVYTQMQPLNADKAKTIKITAKIPAGVTAEMYFATNEKSFSGSTRFAFTSTTDEKAVYTVNTSANPNWTGTITQFRFDPVVGEGHEFEWYSIEFCE